MAILNESMKLNDCPTLSRKWLFQEWDEPCHQIFGELNTKFSSPPVLKFMGFDKPFEVHVGIHEHPKYPDWHF